MEISRISSNKTGKPENDVHGGGVVSDVRARHGDVLRPSDRAGRCRRSWQTAAEVLSGVESPPRSNRTATVNAQNDRDGMVWPNSHQSRSTTYVADLDMILAADPTALPMLTS